jgi:secreted PhoX family phosphatase
VAAGDLWAVPVLGRGTWENVTAVDTHSSEHVALLLGDDSAGAPLYLYVGRKNAVGDGSFLDRNGLMAGNLFAWKSLNGAQSPEDFNGTGNTLKGIFIPVPVRDESMAGQPGYDAEGYLDDNTLRNEAIARGAFQFSRPEDLHTNPHRGTEVVMASTGRGQLFPSDNWGMVYKIKTHIRLESPKGLGFGSAALLTILHDANEHGDFGIRSADNLVWSDNGTIYVQEDRSTNPASLFGSISGREASVWQLHPADYSFEQVAEMDRTAVAPTGSTDSAPTDIGNWESSGILDVTDLFNTSPGETLLLSTIQAHSISDGIIATDGLVQGGQIILISQP